MEKRKWNIAEVLDNALFIAGAIAMAVLFLAIIYLKGSS